MSIGRLRSYAQSGTIRALIFGLFLSGPDLQAQADRIIQQIDRTKTTVLRGNVSPRARAELDQGPVDPSYRLEYVMLLIKPSALQQQALEQLLAEQQDSSSPNYRRWLTPEEYADRFGLSHEDMEKIGTWLRSAGFQVVSEARARNWIAFTGTAEQIGRTFRTEIHRYVLEGETHFANATDPSIPTVLASIVSGIHGFDNFRPKAPNRGRKPIGSNSLQPDYTNLVGTHYLAPDDIATIYNLNPLYAAGIDGTGQKIAVVGQTDINVSDIAAFRSIFNLSNNTPRQYLYGPDPGMQTADVGEAELDLEWAGAVARNATILYVYSTDVFRSVQNAISDNLAPVITMSYGGCEANQSPSVLDSQRHLAQQANVQGITWVASSGDAGAADCDFDPTPAAATHGYAVNFPASIPEVTSVGGTEFNEGASSYWNYWNGNNQGSAVSYIPEKAWNDTYTDGTLAASGGGKSIHYATPWWQAGQGFPNDGGRDVPDVSLAASADHDGYIVCVPNANCPSLTWKLGYFGVFGGTSASTPVFAGILVLLNHYLASHGGQAGLANANPTLYWLAQNSPAAFHDIVTGDNIVPCVIGSTNDCTNGSLGFNAVPGYDRATGLGSVDAYNLITAWGPLPVPLITSISPNTPTASSQNQTVTVNGIGFQNGLRVTATFPNGGTSTLQGSGQIQNVTSNTFQMIITLNGAGTWAIQVIDADGRPSNNFNFAVNPPLQAPTVSTSSASSVANTSATLGGFVNPQGSDTHVWFQYSTNSSMSGSVSTPQQDIGSGTSTVPFSANIADLSGNTTYFFQAWGSNSGGTNQGSILSFTTASTASAPTLSTSPASSVTSNTATLGGSVNPHGADTHVWFQYSTNSSMSGSVATPQQDIGSGTSTVPFSANISGLSNNTTYYFQAWGSNSAGTSQGSILAFATPAAPQAPAVFTSAASSIANNAATLGGSVNPNSGDTHVWFQYSTNSSMSGSIATPQQDIGSGTVTVPFSANVSGLASNTTYYFEALASNSVGTSQGSIASFVTANGSQLTAPNNLMPSDGSTNVSVTPTLTWSTVANASGYLIYFGVTNPPGAAGTTTGANATSYVPGQLGGNTTYYWRVVATNGSASASSPIVSFTTLTPPVTGPVLVSGLSNPSGLVVDADSVYWSEFGGLIRKVPKSGGNPITLFASQYNPSGMAVDNTSIYFGDGVNIRSVPKSGGSSTVLTAANPCAMAVDSNNIYWTDINTGAIRKMPKAGGSPTTIATGTNSPCGITTDGINVYWSEFSWPGTVRRVSVNGGTSTILGNNVNNIGVAVDPTSTNVYWGEYIFLNAGKIDLAPTGGGATTSLVTGLNNVWDVAADGTSVFWVEDRMGGVVGQVALSGGSPATLASNLAEPVALAVDASSVYWIERNGGGAATGTLKVLPKIPTVQVTVGTNPSGLLFEVDGLNYTSQQTFIWLAGTSHTVVTSATQFQTGGAQAIWKSWSDGGQLSHSITPNFNSTFTANFGIQYYLTTSASQGGTVAPSSGWYDAGTVVSISATASAGYSFSGFSGNLAGAVTPQSVVMNGPVNVSANFSLNPTQVALAKAAVFRNGLWVIDLNGNFQWDGTSIDRAMFLGQSGDIPVTGDWNGDGRKKAGIFRNGLWVLDYNGNGQWDGTSIDRAYFLGQAGDIPVVGDWNGTGFDKIGVFRNGLWVLDYNGNGQWDGTSIDRAMFLGQAGDVPVVGDWNGSGTAKVAVFRNGLWVFDYNGNGQWDGTTVDRAMFLGQAGDIPVVGDWNGSGTSKGGVFRNGLWVLDYNGNFQWDGTSIDKAAFLGQSGDVPVVGDWNGSGWSKIGIFRNGLWVFDYNGNFQWDGTTIDRAMVLGQTGDVPVQAKW